MILCKVCLVPYTDLQLTGLCCLQEMSRFEKTKLLIDKYDPDKQFAPVPQFGLHPDQGRCCGCKDFACLDMQPALCGTVTCSPTMHVHRVTWNCSHPKAGSGILLYWCANCIGDVAGALQAVMSSPNPGRPVRARVMRSSTGVAGAAATAVAGAGKAIMPLLDRLATNLIADNPVLLEDLR